MPPRGRHVIGVILIVITLTTAATWMYHLHSAPPRTSLPSFIRNLSRVGADVILVTIDPSAAPPELDRASMALVRSWQVIGRAPITDQMAAKRLVEALDGASSRPSDWPGCFEPRHGLLIRRGFAWAEMVICFECGQTYSAYGVGPITLAYDHIIIMRQDAAPLYNMVARQHRLMVAR